jgi:LysR family transcriptional regulator, hca operon transcriptional activator
MELRHLRYFIAVAEEGSFTQAAEKRLHIAQPSLSRQIRDLEQDVGAELIARGPREMALTDAGRVFLDHARQILLRVEVATEAARRASRPAKTPFTIGFLTGYEMEWLQRALELLRDDLARIELTIHSASSPELMQSLLTGKMDVAFVRPDSTATGLEFIHLATEKLFVLLPAGHRLAKHTSIRLGEITRENFVSFPRKYAPVLRLAIDDYLAGAGVQLTPAHEAETLPMAISLVLSTGGVSLLPEYAARLLPPSVVGRPLRGKAPTVDLAVGFNRTNASPLLRGFLAAAGHLSSRPSST